MVLSLVALPRKIQLFKMIHKSPPHGVRMLPSRCENAPLTVKECSPHGVRMLRRVLSIPHSCPTPPCPTHTNLHHTWMGCLNTGLNTLMTHFLHKLFWRPQKILGIPRVVCRPPGSFLYKFGASSRSWHVFEMSRITTKKSTGGAGVLAVCFACHVWRYAPLRKSDKPFMIN